MIFPMPFTHMHIACFASLSCASLGVCSFRLGCCKFPCLLHRDAIILRLHFINAIAAIVSSCSKINSFTALLSCFGWCWPLCTDISMSNAMGQAIHAKEATDLTSFLVQTAARVPILLPHIGRTIWRLILDLWVFPIQAQPMVDQRNSQVHLKSVPSIVAIQISFPRMLRVVLHNVLHDAEHCMHH